MVLPVDRLDRSVTEFMRFVPVFIGPILYRAEYRGRLLPESEVMVVMTLSDLGPLSPTLISRGLNMQKGSLTSVLRRLEKLGLTGRRANPQDDRSYIAELTPEGAEFAQSFGQKRSEALRDLFQPMTPGDNLAAATGLDLISTHFQKLEEATMAMAQDEHTKTLNWYHAASPEDRKEYDAFGPWLSEVKVAEDMPPRFRSFFADNKEARFFLKVPKNADRRQLRPGMDLYDSVLAVHDHGIFVVRLEDGGVTRSTADWDDVAAVGSYGDRLQGVWTLYLKDGTRTSISYNKVSTDLMDQVTDFARTRLGGLGAEDVEVELPAAPAVEFTDADLFYGSAMLELGHRGSGSLVPIHFEAPGQRCFDAAGSRAVTTGVLFLDTPGELVILNRDKPSHRRGEAWYAANDIFIPYERITHYSLIPAPTGGAGHFHTLLLRLDGQVIEQPCLGVPEVVMATLRVRCRNVT